MNTFDIKFVEVGSDFNHSHLSGFIKVYKEAFSQPPYNETYSDEEVNTDVWTPHLKDGCIILALENEQVVGLGCTISMDKWEHDPEFQAFIEVNRSKLPNDDLSKICWMSEVAVLPTHWRRGIGTKLAETRIAWGKKNNFTHFMLRTAKKGSNSIKMWQNLSGKVIEGLIQDVSTHAKEVNSQSTERVYISGIIK